MAWQKLLQVSIREQWRTLGTVLLIKQKEGQEKPVTMLLSRTIINKQKS